MCDHTVLAATWFTYPGGMEGWVDLGGCFWYCTGSAKKTWHFTFVHIYWSIFKILSLAHFADNLR